MRKLLGILLCSFFVFVTDVSAKRIHCQKSDREVWCDVMYRMAEPVLKNMSQGTLQKNMQLELSPTWDGRDHRVSYMECFGRLMDGLAPWLTLPDDNSTECVQRRQLRTWALQCYKNAVNPDSPDYLLWDENFQTLVDAAYLAESFMRGYDVLWIPLDSVTKQRYIDRFTKLRRINPLYTNWLLFTCTIETFLHKVGSNADMYRIDSSLRKISEWYVGDGWYSDGPSFAFDYYNSFTIQPMFFNCLEVMTDKGQNKKEWSGTTYELATRRMQRFAVILEHLISPEGSFPVFGRSITYRTGVLQPLALLAWKGLLPTELSKGQVRAGMTAVIKKMFLDNHNFNKSGFLTLGFNGSQPKTANVYTDNGSLYLASLAFLPLGLDANDPFWTDKSEKWTSKKAWEGDEFPKDHTYYEKFGINYK